MHHIIPCLVIDKTDKIIYGKKVKKQLLPACNKELINNLTADEISTYQLLDRQLAFAMSEKTEDFFALIQRFVDRKLTKEETLEFIRTVEDYKTNVKKKYVSFVQIPGYEPCKNYAITLDDLYDDEAYQKLLSYIDTLDLDDAHKHFLRLAASRFLRFDYRLIADYYYTTENEELRSAFRTLLLVLVDENEVIQNEYITLTKRVLELFKREYGAVGAKNEK